MLTDSLELEPRLGSVLEFDRTCPGNISRTHDPIFFGFMDHRILLDQLEMDPGNIFRMGLLDFENYVFKPYVLVVLFHDFSLPAQD